MALFSYFGMFRRSELLFSDSPRLSGEILLFNLERSAAAAAKPTAGKPSATTPPLHPEPLELARGAETNVELAVLAMEPRLLTK